MAIEALTLGTDQKTNRIILILASTRERVLAEPCSPPHLLHFPLGTSLKEAKRIIEEDGTGIGADAYFAEYLHPYSTTIIDGGESDNLTGAYIEDYKKDRTGRCRSHDIRHRTFVSPVMYFKIFPGTPAS